MKKTAIIGTVLLSLLLPSCTEIWGELDNPADPEATSYQGYETVKEADAVAPVQADSGVLAYIPKLVAVKVAGAQAYQFRVSATDDYTAYIYQSAETTVNEYLPVDYLGLSAATTYYWFVRAKVGGNWGAWSEETAKFSLSAITGLSPAHGGTSFDTTPLLDWADSPDAVSYIIQIAATEGGLISAPELTALASQYQTTETLAVGETRWWRVCALNAATQRGPWTAAASFTIVPPPPSPPHLLTPADASSTTIAQPSLTWTAVDGAASYEIALATTEVLLAGASPEVAAGTNWMPASDLAMGAWYWRVRCVDAYGAKGEWSAARSFERPYSIGDTGPAGGKVFYDKGDYYAGWRYLETAQSDQSTGMGIVWWNGSNVTTGATATAIGTGEANTATIVSVQGAGSYAASLCANLSLGGYDDWFLPSLGELYLMYGQKGAIGGFASYYYWSSSEYGYGNAWLQYFDNGYQNYPSKNYPYGRVRAIRAF